MYLDALLVTGPFEFFSLSLYVGTHHVDVFVIVDVGSTAVGGVGVLLVC